jgi:hypothetical protein
MIVERRGKPSGRNLHRNEAELMGVVFGGAEKRTLARA